MVGVHNIALTWQQAAAVAAVLLAVALVLRTSDQAAGAAGWRRSRWSRA